MPNIFISYRREDVSGHAGRLASELSARFGHGSVFIDIDAISPGVDFEQRIQQALDECQVTLVLIGDEWLTTERDGRRRIDQEGDYVRMEIAAALAREDMTVIPVLIESTQMPSPAELPADISGLAKINACELTTKRWGYDFSRLQEIVGREDTWRRRLLRTTPRWAKRASPFLAVAVAATVIAIVLAGGSKNNGAQVAAPNGPKGEIGYSGIGPVDVGDSLDQVRAQFGAPDKTQRVSERVTGCFTAIRWTWDQRNGSFSAYFDSSKRKLASYTTTSPNFPTTLGNRVNDSFQSVRDTWASSLHPLNVGVASTPQDGYWYVSDVGKNGKPVAPEVTAYSPKILYTVAGGHVRSIAGGEVPVCE
jgi:hypothetical protein